MFNHSHGLYADVWSAWTELGINITVTLVAGYYWGISGILLGKIVSTSLIIVIWKPYYLFHSGLHESIIKYWHGAIRNFGVSGISFIIAHLLINTLISCKTTHDEYLSFIIYCLEGITIYLFVNILLISFFCKGAKDCYNRLWRITKTNK